MAAVATTNGRLAVMEWCQVWEPGIPLSPVTFGQDDQQQLLWDFPEVLWTAAAGPAAFILDLNTRLRVFLEAYYSLSPSTADLTSMIAKYLRDMLTVTGDYDTRFRRLIDDATP